MKRYWSILLVYVFSFSFSQNPCSNPEYLQLKYWHGLGKNTPKQEKRYKELLRNCLFADDDYEGYYSDTPAPLYVEGEVKYPLSNQSNNDLDFYNAIKGNKYAWILTNKDFLQKFEEGNQATVNVITMVKKYLLNIGFERILYTQDEVSEALNNSKVSACDIMQYGWWTKEDELNFEFRDCIGNSFNFTGSFDTISSRRDEDYYNLLKSSFWHNVPRSEKYRQELPKIMTDWSENNIKTYFDDNGAGGIEGIYERLKLNNKNWTDAKYKIGIIKSENGYDAIYLNGANNPLDWKEGELKANIIPTATNNFFKVSWIMAQKQKNEDIYCTIDDNNMLSVVFPEAGDGVSVTSKYLKLYPINSSIKSSGSRAFASSGTGFVISKNGFIVTNHHVIDKASTIKVEITKIGMKQTFNADVVMSDKRNDLAILKVNDPSFNGFKGIPYMLNPKVLDMGESVFTLGYPLISTMGESIKLTDGLISSKMGFQGDITSYQISAAVQPGNSGGPLFDNDGNIIGVVNASHREAENVNYAIKSNYLINLIELLPNPPDLPKRNSLRYLSLSDKVKETQDFILLIKTK